MSRSPASCWHIGTCLEGSNSKPKPQREDMKTVLPSRPLLSHCCSMWTAWCSSRLTWKQTNPAWVTAIGLKLGRTKQTFPRWFHCLPRKPMASRGRPRLNLGHREHVSFHRERWHSTFRGTVSEWTEVWRRAVSAYCYMDWFTNEQRTGTVLNLAPGFLTKRTTQQDV